jgi:hypothetical protein
MIQTIETLRKDNGEIVVADVVSPVLWGRCGPHGRLVLEGGSQIANIDE